jgi:hypothetical protein
MQGKWNEKIQRNRWRKLNKHHVVVVWLPRKKVPNRSRYIAWSELQPPPRALYYLKYFDDYLLKKVFRWPLKLPDIIWHQCYFWGTDWSRPIKLTPYVVFTWPRPWTLATWIDLLVVMVSRSWHVMECKFSSMIINRKMNCLLTNHRTCMS